MKFLHMADPHLGVAPDTGKPWSEQRKQDIWNSFFETIAYAKQEQVELLLIAGDLFHRQPLKRELKEVAGQFASIPDTEVVLIAGNHDYLHPKSYYHGFEWPENVHMMYGEQLERLHLEKLNTTIWGASYWKADDRRKIYDDMEALPKLESVAKGAAGDGAQSQPGYNILLGHGGDEQHRPFNARRVAEAGFDYAAFGHIHKAEQMIPGKVVMAGALEPTDCNDFGPHGFWVGTLDEAGCEVKFLPIKKCEYIKQELVVNGKMTWAQIVEAAKELLAQRESYQISHLRILGYRDGDLEINKEELLALERVVRVTDETVPDYQFEKLKVQHEGTLLGSFIEEVERHPDQALAKDALYYGVWAMMESMN